MHNMGIWHTTKPGSCWGVSPCVTLLPPVSQVSILLLVLCPRGHGSKPTGSPIRLPLAELQRVRICTSVGIWKAGRKIQAVLLPSLLRWVSSICTQEREFTAGWINQMWGSATQSAFGGFWLLSVSLVLWTGIFPLSIKQAWAGMKREVKQPLLLPACSAGVGLRKRDTYC